MRYTLLLFIFSASLLACGSDCRAKLTDSNTFKNSSFSIPVSLTTRLIHTTTKPTKNLLLYDPFLALAIIKKSDYFKYPFRMNYANTNSGYIYTKKSVEVYKNSSRAIGLNLPRLTHGDALILSECCFLESLIVSNKVIDKAYLKRFVVYKKNSYSDIGIRFGIKKNIVKYSDPFFENNPFKVGDEIVSVDNKKYMSSSALMRKILFYPVNKFLHVKIKRDNKVMKLSVKTHKRDGGGFISDTFLEKFGIYINKDMVVEKSSDSFGINVNDKLLKINKKVVKTYDDIKNAFSKKADKYSILIDRDGFQFFIDLK